MIKLKKTTQNTDNAKQKDLTIFYFIDTNPLPKERPRINRYGGARTPEKTKTETLLQNLRSRAHAPAGGPYGGAIQIILNYYLKYNKQTKDTTPHTGTPDTDNLAKLTLDAITEAARFWHDDSQINSVLITKQYSRRPGLGVAIKYNNLTHPDTLSVPFIIHAINNKYATQQPETKNILKKQYKGTI